MPVKRGIVDMSIEEVRRQWSEDHQAWAVYGERHSQCENAADYGCRSDVFGGGDSCASGLL